MTTLSYLPSHLSRLFDRIDAAAVSSEALVPVFEEWKRLRGERFAPREGDLADLPERLATATFIVRPWRGEDEVWQITKAGQGAAGLLKLDPADRRLSKLGEVRIAARLRRLFQMVAESSEPLSALFRLNVGAGRSRQIEVLVAPLSSNGRSVDGMFGGIAGPDRP
jgi:ribose-phosphate pyrophosphokinase